MFCSHCGFKVDSSQAICPQCGERLHADKRKMPFWFKLLLGLALAALLLGLGLFIFEDKPEATVESQLNALGKNQLTEAYYGYTSNLFQEATSLEKFKELIRSFPMLSHVQKIEVLRAQEEGDSATLHLSLTPLEGTPFLMEYGLDHIDGSWKIVYFKLVETVTDDTLPTEPKPTLSEPKTTP